MDEGSWWVTGWIPVTKESKENPIIVNVDAAGKLVGVKY